jgi:HD-like signal output (HDOD) protein
LTAFEPLILDLIARNAVKVPPFPGVALRMQQLVASEKHDVPSLTRLVAADQALTAAVLRAANSSVVRGVDRITALPNAIARLGAEELCRIAIASSLGQCASREGPLAELRRMSWRRGLTSALIGKALAARRRLNADEVFVCGLLHDFGWLVGIAGLEELLVRRPQEPARAAADWMAIIDPFHVPLGMLVCEQWKLSPLLREVIGAHHDPQSARTHRALVDLIGAADAVVGLLETRPGVSVDDLVDLRIGATRDELQALVQVLPQVRSLVAYLIDLDPGQPVSVTSKVAPPATALKGPLRAVELAARWLRPGGNTPIKVIALSPDGLVVLLAERPRENFLMRIAVTAPGGRSIELFGNAVLSTRKDREHRTEIQLFGLDRQEQTDWDRLYAGAG